MNNKYAEETEPHLHLQSHLYTAISERLSEKVHETIPKGIVGGFECTVLQRNLKKWYGMFAIAKGKQPK